MMIGRSGDGAIGDGRVLARCADVDEEPRGVSLRIDQQVLDGGRQRVLFRQRYGLGAGTRR